MRVLFRFPAHEDLPLEATDMTTSIPREGEEVVVQVVGLQVWLVHKVRWVYEFKRATAIVYLVDSGKVTNEKM